MLKNIYLEYQDSVAFYAIGVDPTESLSHLRKQKVTMGYDWPVAKAPTSILKDYRIITQSTKVAIDVRGIIIFRAGYGMESEERWRRVFGQLSNEE